MARYRVSSPLANILTIILVIALIGGAAWGISYFVKSCDDEPAAEETFKISYIDSSWYARNNVNDDKLTMSVTEKAYKTGYVMTFTPATIDGYTVEEVKCNDPETEITVSDANVVTVTAPADIDKDTFSVMVIYTEAEETK